MKNGTYWITDRKQLAALASPMRQEIVDAVSAAGACTIARIAEVLSCRPDRLYFHIRRLASAGLLIERGVNGKGREAATLYDVPGRPLRIRLDRRGKETSRGITGVHDGILRLARRDLRRALADPDSVMTGDLRDTWAGRSRGWLTADELRRFNRHLEKILALVRKGSWREGSRPVAFTFVITPPRTQSPIRKKKMVGGAHPTGA